MTRKLFDMRYSLLLALQVLILGLLFYSFTSEGPEEEVDWTIQRQIANKLHSAGVTQMAIKHYEQFLENPEVKAPERAKIAFSIGELYENEQKLEEAIAWYYQVELSDPKSEQVTTANKRIVALLEKLQKFNAAKRQLARATSLSTQEKPVGAVTVAKIGEREIFQHQVDEALDGLPQSIKSNFTSKQGKEQFLKKYVADELLYDKAIRLGMDDDSFAKQFAQIKKQLMIQKIIEDEVQKKVKLDPVDVKNYFDANQDKYKRAESADISMIKVKSKGDAEKALSELKSGKLFSQLATAISLDESTKESGGKVGAPIVRGQAFLSFDSAVTDTILAKPEGLFTEQVLAKGFYYLFKIRKKYPPVEPKFEDIKAQVENDYRMIKSQSLYQTLIEQTLANEKVVFYAENLQ